MKMKIEKDSTIKKEL